MIETIYVYAIILVPALVQTILMTLFLPNLLRYQYFLMNMMYNFSEKSTLEH